MSTIEQVLSYGFGQRAVLAAAMVGFVNGYLGGYLVLRRDALFAGALSHTLFPGIALGALIAGLNPVSALVGAAITALVVGLSATGVANTSRLDKEAALAILYTAAFGVGLIVLSRLSTYVRIDDYLFGNILAVSNQDLWFVFVAGGVIMSVLILLARPLLLFLFSEEVAATQGVPVNLLRYLLSGLLVLTMITSLQAVGVILTLGLLVAPASILYLYSNSPRVIFWGGGVLGGAVSVACVFISHGLDLQTGPSIVVALGILFAIGYLASPRYGLAASLFRRRHMMGDEDGAQDSTT